MTSQDNVILLQNLTEQKARQILKEVIRDSFNIKFRPHALERMEERGITRPQIIRVLQRGRFEEPPHRTPYGNWKMTLSGISAGHDIKVACALDYKEETGNYVVIITTYIV
ncbi:MAG: DUF4258 domain-containing protein [gamma proteobacterium symbiont of Taylorina sp.]|nr:DUF4258 domain-containing protein [gamma proteobacterium symbiont of Taylorina sp.]